LNRWKIKQAARCIATGGVVAYPTEAVYGLGCDPRDPDAVARILTIKQRPAAKGLILIAAHLEQLLPYIAPLSEPEIATVNATWPGAVTWLVKPSGSAPYWITGDHKKIAVRVTAHPMAKALCEACGQAIVSTSANPSALPPAKSPLSVRHYFSDQVDFILTGALGAEKKPTQIKDLETGIIIRPS
jgi:L-threonylcarbamoyladenylate synthase